MKTVIITKEELHFGGLGFDQGIYQRIGQKIARRNVGNAKFGLPPLGPTQERNMLIGEIGEVALRKTLIERGETVLDDSWTQFSTGTGFETVIDLAVHDGHRRINYQVKSSEAGRREIKFEMLKKCIESPLHYLVFVAVRALYSPVGDITFECQITSQMAPRHIPQLATWTKKDDSFVHRENKVFMADWLSQSQNYKHQGKSLR